MSKEKFNANNKEWKKILAKDKELYLLYAPFHNANLSSPYWDEKHKIVFFALESCTGEKNPGDVNENDWNRTLDWKTFQGTWMKREDNYTIRRYSVFAYCLYKLLSVASRGENDDGKIDKEIKRLKSLFLKALIKTDLRLDEENRESLYKEINTQDGKSLNVVFQKVGKCVLNEKVLKALYEDIGTEDIEEVMQKILYMNLLKWVNNTGTCNFDEGRQRKFDEFLSKDTHRKLTLASIAYSDANIVIISGKNGINNCPRNIDGYDICDLFNAEDEEMKKYRKMLGYPSEVFNLEWDHGRNMIQYGKILFVSLYHPGRYDNKYFTPEYILDRVIAIVNTYKVKIK
jgi:hypothetical protein